MFSVIWVKYTGDVVMFWTKQRHEALRYMKNDAEFSFKMQKYHLTFLSYYFIL